MDTQSTMESKRMKRVSMGAVVCFALIAAAATTSATTQSSPSPPHIAASATPSSPMPLHDARQLVLVLSADWDAPQARLARFERDTDDGEWRILGDTVPVTIGRNGAAWGLGLHPAQSDGPQKREGDGRAPAGVFTLGTAFGYGADAKTSLPYTAMQPSHWCIDVADSPLYNRIVDATDVGDAAIAGSTEPMRRDLHADGDPRYALGFVIGHNVQATPSGGSCIFAHLWKAPGEATAGCTAMDETAMRELLAWLDPARMPRFVLLPQAEYTRVSETWHLPAIE